MIYQAICIFSAGAGQATDRAAYVISRQICFVLDRSCDFVPSLGVPIAANSTHRFDWINIGRISGQYRSICTLIDLVQYWDIGRYTHRFGSILGYRVNTQYTHRFGSICIGIGWSTYYILSGHAESYWQCTHFYWSNFQRF